MKQLTSEVCWLTDAVGARCYWLDLGPEQVAIVDPGTLLGVNRVARELRRAGRSPYEVTDILLTHGDVDHAQAAAEWQRRTGARVWLGEADAQILSGVSQPESRLRKVTSRLGTAELPDNLQLLSGDAEIGPGLTALWTRGHTPGHHSFHYRTVLFAGDAARCAAGELVPMREWLHDNPGQAAASLARLQAIEADWYCCGHSDPAKRR
jgi:hydroxyacylglutathione hydrolase